MKFKLVICMIITALFFSSNCISNTEAEPSKNMKFIINDCVSLMDSLCCQLERQLHEHFASEFHGIHNLMYEHGKKIGDKKLIAYYKNVRDDHERYYPSIHFKVYFDYSSNCLTVNCVSHAGKKFEEFKQYWEEPNPVHDFLTPATITEILEQNYKVGKFNTISIDEKHYKKPNGSVIKLSPEIKYPCYEALRAQIYEEIDDFKFHYGYSSTVYDEDIIRKELIERLIIKIFHVISYPKSLYREFYDGNWKKLSLSHKKK